MAFCKQTTRNSSIYQATINSTCAWEVLFFSVLTSLLFSFMCQSSCSSVIPGILFLCLRASYDFFRLRFLRRSHPPGRPSLTSFRGKFGYEKSSLLQLLESLNLLKNGLVVNQNIKFLQISFIGFPEIKA